MIHEDVRRAICATGVQLFVLSGLYWEKMNDLGPMFWLLLSDGCLSEAGLRNSVGRAAAMMAQGMAWATLAAVLGCMEYCGSLQLVLQCHWSRASSLASSKRNLVHTHQTNKRQMVKKSGFISSMHYCAKPKLFSRCNLLYNKIYFMNTGLLLHSSTTSTKKFSLINTSKFSFFIEKCHHVIYEMIRSGDKENISEMWLCTNCLVLEISSHSVIYFSPSKIIIFV